MNRVLGSAWQQDGSDTQPKKSAANAVTVERLKMFEIIFAMEVEVAASREGLIVERRVHACVCM